MAKIKRNARELEQLRAQVAELEQENADLRAQLEQRPAPAKKAAAPKSNR